MMSERTCDALTKAKQRGVVLGNPSQTISRLQGAGVEVMIVGPVPYIGCNVPSVLAARTFRNRAAYRFSRKIGCTIDAIRIRLAYLKREQRLSRLLKKAQ